MKVRHLCLSLLITCLMASGCSRSSGEWADDTRSAGRHLGNSFRALGGKDGDSRQVHSQTEFAAQEPQDFIPLEDEAGNAGLSLSEGAQIPQSKESPGEQGSAIPGIDAFTDAGADPTLAGVFQIVHFPYDSDLIKGKENLDIVNKIVSYMKKNPNVYIFVEGHCDERGSAAYNLALGSRRSNSVRTQLVRAGVNPDNVFTVSYGKEKPMVLGHEESMWSKNRRAEFKIFHRS